MSVLLGPDGLPISSQSELGTSAMPVNNNWLMWAQQYVEGLENPDKIPFSDYQKMMQTDETVYTAVEYLRQLILNQLGDYTHPEEAQQQLVRRNFQRMKGSILASIKNILSAIPYGFSVTEKLWSILPNGEVALSGLQTLHPKSITFDVHQQGQMKNELRWIKQHWRGFGEVEIPVNKAIVFTHDFEFGNFYGTSRLKRAWKSWKMKEVLLKAYAITLERYGSPLTVAKTGNVAQLLQHPKTGEKVTAAAYLTEVMDSLSYKGSMVVPLGTELDIQKSGAVTVGSDFLSAITYLNRSISLAIGPPSLMFDAGTVGSQSLGQEHSKNFKLLVASIQVELTECLLEQLVRELLDYNFGPQDDYGMFQFEEFDPDLALKQAQIAEKLRDTGIVNMDDLDDVNHFREQQRLPLWTEDDLQRAIAASKAADPFPTMDPMANPVADADAGEDTQPDSAGNDPDADGFSIASKRRRALRCKAEMFRRISREAKARRAESAA